MSIYKAFDEEKALIIMHQAKNEAQVRIRVEMIYAIDDANLTLQNLQ